MPPLVKMVHHAQELDTLQQWQARDCTFGVEGTDTGKRGIIKCAVKICGSLNYVGFLNTISYYHKNIESVYLFFI